MTAPDPFAPAALARAVADAPSYAWRGRIEFAGPAGGTLDEANVVSRPDPGALNVLALDLGTATGWALRTPACIASGTKSWAERSRETRGDRLLRLWRWLHDIQRAAPLSLVAYELVQHMGTNQRLAAHCYAQFQAVVLMFAARNGIDVKEVHTGTLKKATTGRGAFPKGQAKDAMKAAVTAQGFTPETYDEADAIAVLLWATR